MPPHRKHLVGTFSTLVGVNGFLAGLSFLTTLAVASRLGREGFGNLAFAMAIGGYCVTIAYAGLNRTLVRDLVHFPSRFGEYVNASVVLRGSILAATITGFVVVRSTGGFNRLALAGLMIVLAEGLKALYLGPVFDARGEMKLHATFFLAERLVYFAAIWVLIIFWGESLSLMAIAVSMLLSTLVGLTLQYWRIRQTLNYHIDRESFRLAGTMLRKNVWVWGALLAALSFGALSKIVMGIVSGSGELGEYAVAWQVVMLGTLLFAQIARIGDPWMARVVLRDDSRSHRLRLVLTYGVLLMAVAAVVGLPAILFPSTLLRVVGPEFAGAAGALRVLGVYVIVLSFGQMTSQYLVAVRREGVYASVTVIAGVLALVLLLVFVPRWSSVGASVAVLVSHGFGIAVSLVFVFRHVLRRQTADNDPIAAL